MPHGPIRASSFLRAMTSAQNRLGPAYDVLTASNSALAPASVRCSGVPTTFDFSP